MGSRPSSAERIDVTSASLHALLTRVQPKLATDEYRELQAIIDTLLHLADLLAKKRTSIARLRALLFGACTETTRKVLAKVGLRCATQHTSPAHEGTSSEARGDKRCKGHGRNGAAAYAGGQQIHVPHPHLKPGDHCPLCAKGKVYDQRDPHVLVRFVAQAPIGAKVTVLETLRCNLCGEIFTAPVPDDVGDEKCDASTGAMIALLKYGCGVPFNRLARLQASVEIPLPVSTQWEIVAAVAKRIQPMLDELTRQAADGELLHNDDTPMRVLSLLRKETAGTPDLPASPPPALPVDSTADDVAPERTGVFTSGIVAKCGDHRVALFLTGRHHAGENLATVLARPQSRPAAAHPDV